ncbi:MAG: flagellar filament outer layer protein FlaA [Treponema sp.]|nr:flagellar filament outer layer protein FlaA [Treponema sp.]
MKKMLILVAIVSLVAGSLFAEEAVLIDFSKLAADIHVSVGPNDEDDTPNQNRATMMDYSGVRFGGSFTEEQKSVMRTSLAIANWEVLLASSARTVNNMVRSYTREAQSKQWGTVMGARIHFPVESYNSWAVIKPPFEIPAFEPQADVQDDGTIEPADDSNGITGPSRFEDGFGVVKNVGTIKSLAVNVYGLNFPHGLSALVIDGSGNQKSMFMGYLTFDGWGELRWDNPAYIQEVRNRDLRLIPLYPESTPFVKFAGFEIKRDASRVGGDFITYFKDVKLIYDKAVLDTDRDIDDESLWRIIQDRETARKVWEMERFGQNQVLRYLDSQKQATESTFTPTATNE